ncbi:hypothetical protein [Enterovibrio norvegicus]|uniref:hypothetical protein n=1 Tax=Enterovibrio norvegicus TaxID=188144 RepID=UPI000C81657E|nr:hypothetical protein [Enterovibrio norvegicus]PMH64457.1 hypothetical protein BCU62_15495 [Enterovibrio norvegicus]
MISPEEISMGSDVLAPVLCLLNEYQDIENLFLSSSTFYLVCHESSRLARDFTFQKRLRDKLYRLELTSCLQFDFIILDSNEYHEIREVTRSDSHPSKSKAPADLFAKRLF